MTERKPRCTIMRNNCDFIQNEYNEIMDKMKLFWQKNNFYNSY